MKIQFIHSRVYEEVFIETELDNIYEKVHVLNPRGGFTVAMEEVPVEVFDQLEENVVFTKQFGIALCHNDDNYNKHIGRITAFQDMSPVQFTVLEVDITEEGRAMLIETAGGSQFVLRKLKNSSRVHFLEKGE